MTAADFWWQAATQFVGDLGAGLILVVLAVWAEAKLDEWRERRHDR